MRRADELPTARSVIDRHPHVGTGLFARYEIAVGQAHQYTALAIGRVGEADRAIIRHVGMTDYRAGM